VRVLGDDVLGVERHELRRRFAVVPQDVVLFPGTIAENVAAGAEPDRERVRAVLERIGALDLLTARPGGLDAPVGERGGNFSAGERQLIAFARALYRDAPILILDEATASIDSDTESRLQRALVELLKGRTALVIAPPEHDPHRRSHWFSSRGASSRRVARCPDGQGRPVREASELQFAREHATPSSHGTESALA
jgi:ABC-type multidrug transport system fused ATPase/permease subunit